MQLSQYLLVAVESALAAGEKILQVYNSTDFQVQMKSDNSPLTTADLESHKVIREILSQKNIPILSEEGKEMQYSHRKNWSQLWMVDPLDGTKEFIKRNGEFTVNIALIENGNPVLGVIYVPVTSELYLSDTSIGAHKLEGISLQNSNDFISNSILNAYTKLPAKQNKKLKYTVVGSRSHMSEETQAFISELEKEKGDIEILSRGSSLKICMVAEGKADIYPRFGPTMEWDTAAGHAIAIGAGFNLCQVKTGKPLVYNKENLLNPWFIVKKKVELS